MIRGHKMALAVISGHQTDGFLIVLVATNTSLRTHGKEACAACYHMVALQHTRQFRHITARVPIKSQQHVRVAVCLKAIIYAISHVCKASPEILTSAGSQHAAQRAFVITYSVPPMLRAQLQRQQRLPKLKQKFRQALPPKVSLTWRTLFEVSLSSL